MASKEVSVMKSSLFFDAENVKFFLTKIKEWDKYDDLVANLILHHAATISDGDHYDKYFGESFVRYFLFELEKAKSLLKFIRVVAGRRITSFPITSKVVALLLERIVGFYALHMSNRHEKTASNESEDDEGESESESESEDDTKKTDAEDEWEEYLQLKREGYADVF